MTEVKCSIVKMSYMRDSGEESLSIYLRGPSDPPLFPRNPFHVPFTLRTELIV